ncbi:hypothetical protein [Celeribacter marinus]|uniref:hypothetical protein n=1 Tax=Celeribacter marinus TaxID=1397108 RepID=UPI003177E29A
MSEKNDPAYNYISQKNNGAEQQGLEQSENYNSTGRHGIFTDIAYGTAWTIGILGTLIGLIFIFSFQESMSGAEASFMVGIPIILSSWISASVLGVLAEISRKLTT